jgi:hypothetical protein
VALAALKWLEDHAHEGTLNAQAYAQTPTGTIMMTEITGNLSNIKRHYWEA